jgi:hypothetical protein
MDFKEKLKNRLNIKFEPIKVQPASMKRLALPDRISKEFSHDRAKDK